ncbi:MAG TPA: helix-turn-helix domain-containing protein [Candidatus Thermoplasmatota archaeon]|nr:helix-turn-helix domain-containing protein [Candidatus Thermoplasmatota archaeon]
MRLPFVVAMLALTGTCGYAVAVPMLDTRSVEVSDLEAASSRLPPLVLDERPLAALAEKVAPAPTDLVEAASQALAFETPQRVDALPRFLLLPDGELLAAATSSEPLYRDNVVRAAPPAAAPEEAPSRLLIPDSKLARLEEAGPSTYFQGKRMSAPDAEPLPAPAVFQPSAASVSGTSRTYWTATGLAALGAATLLGFALYHRIRPNAALENETRKTIFEAVCAQPGLGVHEVSKLAGVSYSTATYHLERLVGAGMIVMTPDGNKLCYYKNGGAFTESERRILPLIKNEEAAKLFEAILTQPGTYRAALAEQLGVTATTINWHLRRLRDAGLVDETRAGRSAHLYAKIDALRPTFLALATKVEGTEPATAAKLRGYAMPGGPGSTPGASA